MKWLLGIALTLVTLVIVAVLALFLVPTEKIAGLAAERFEEATGRNLSIEGPVRATLWPRLGVRAEGIVVANAPWSGQDPMLRADAMDIGVTLASVLGDTIQVEVLEVDGAQLLLERRADGTGNWEMAHPSSVPSTPSAGSGATPQGTPARRLSIERALLQGADITFVDHGADASWRLRAVDLSASIPDLEGPVSVEGSALFNGVAITAGVSVTALQALLDGALVPVAAQITSGETDISFDGRVDLDPLSFDGRTNVSSSDGFAVLAALGVALPDLPNGFGANTIALQTAATFVPAGSLHLRDMTLALDGNTINGDVDLLPGDERPKITATLAAPSLDLTGSVVKGREVRRPLCLTQDGGAKSSTYPRFFWPTPRSVSRLGPLPWGMPRLIRYRWPQPWIADGSLSSFSRS